MYTHSVASEMPNLLMFFMKADVLTLWQLWVYEKQGFVINSHQYPYCDKLLLQMNEMVMIEMKGFSDSPSNLEGCLETHRSNGLTNGDFDVRLTTNRLSAPECGVDGIRPLHKSLTSSSLVDVSEGGSHIMYFH